jgi:methylglutaconyl-CoA hydratase
VKNDYQYIEVVIQGTLVWINLNRPNRHNAMLPGMILELQEALDDISIIDQLNFVVLSGNGPSFCAGADLNWFTNSDKLTLEQSVIQYKILADMLLKLFKMPQITIAVVQGKVFGGGIGLMATCDFILAESNTLFRFSEVKLGLLPATILPFISKRISIQNLRKWILTGNLFNISEAYQAGLVDIQYADSQLEPILYELLASFEAASPSAVKRAKTLINQIAAGEIGVNDTALTSTILSEAVLSADGKEGIRAFFEKRKPVWRK